MTARPVFTYWFGLGASITDPDGVVITDPDDIAITDVDGWVDVTDDVIMEVSPTYTRGNMGHEIFDRMSNEGYFNFALDNSINNSAALAGYYSPDSGNCRVGFAQELPVLIKAAWNATTYLEWKGNIVTIKPDAGIHGRRFTLVSAVDWMRFLSDTVFESTAVQLNKRDNELITSLLALVPVPPEETNFDTGDDQYTYAFHDERSGSSTLARLFQKLTMSGLGKIYLRSSATSAESLTYISRTGALLTTTPVATLNNDMYDLGVVRDETTRIKKIVVVTYPAQVDASNVVIWQLNRSIALTGGQSITFQMRLRDPSGRAVRVASYSTVAPVADTDYKFSSVDGSGNDKNADITFSYATGADMIEVTARNTSGVTGYLWFFQPRGKSIYLYEPVPIAKATGQTRGETLQIDMYYQDDPLVGVDISTIVSAWYATPISNVAQVKFIASYSDTLMTAFFAVQPGDFVQISETQTGLDQSFFVNGITKEIREGGREVAVTWALSLANQLSGVFILDQGVLDVDALGA